MDSKFLSSSQWLIEDYAEFLEAEGVEERHFEKSSGGKVDLSELLTLQMMWADEIHLSKIVDAILSYLADLIACAYHDNPDLIPSRARFDLDFVRRFRTINDAIRGGALAELERISRCGFSELLSEAKRVTGCKLPQVVESKFREFVKLRNEIVHKQGSYPEIIGSMYKKKITPKGLFRHHKPGDTANAEVVACQVVGAFEVAAIKAGIEIAARKRDIFKGTHVLER